MSSADLFPPTLYKHCIDREGPQSQLFSSSDLHQIHDIGILVAFLQHFGHQIKSLLWLTCWGCIEALQEMDTQCKFSRNISCTWRTNIPRCHCVRDAGLDMGIQQIHLWISGVASGVNGVTSGVYTVWSLQGPLRVSNCYQPFTYSRKPSWVPNPHLGF